MSLYQTVQAELARITCPAAGAVAVSTSAGQHHFQAELAILDSLGCSFNAFEVRSDRLSTASIEQLKKVAERLSSRLTYLLEPIKPIEVDTDQCIVQLRSVPPQKSDDGTSYYELQVARGGVLNLARFHSQPGQSRKRIAAHVTREVFIRLVKDFEEGSEKS